MRTSRLDLFIIPIGHKKQVVSSLFLIVCISLVCLPLKRNTYIWYDAEIPFCYFVGFQGESLSSKMVSGIPQKYSVRLSGCECCAIAVVNFGFLTDGMRNVRAVWRRLRNKSVIL